MSKLRVLHIIHKLDPGGAEAVVVDLVNNMNHDTIETRVCALVSGGVLTKALSDPRGTLVEMNKKKGNDISLPFKLSKAIKRFKPHVVHTHCWGSLVEGYVASRLAGVSVVVHTEHGTIEQKYHNRIVQRCLWRRHRKIIAVSKEHRGRLSETIKFPGREIDVVYNGVDTEKFKPDPEANRQMREQLGVEEGAFCIGTIGRLEPVKDQATLIRAFSIFSREIPHSRLLLIGDGQLRDRLASLADELNVKEKVLFLGYRSDTSALLNVLDVFVLPSISEGTSCTLLEAMSTGLPIVATHVGGNPEILSAGNTGTLVPVGNPEAITRALKEFYQRPDLTNENARERIARHFSTEKMVEAHTALYRRAMDGL